MPIPARRPQVLDKLETLAAALHTATALAAEVLDDALLPRLIAAFHAMPAGDRATIVGVVEREVQARLLSRATEGVTGQGAHPNPNARLYVRTHGREAQRHDFERDDMMLGMLRVLKVLPILTVPEIRAEWREASREALAEVDDEVVEVMDDVIGEFLDLVRSVRATARRSAEEP